MMKKEYTKPTAKVMEWNFNEDICQTTVANNSGNVCLGVEVDSSASGLTVTTDSHETGHINWSEW